MTIDTALKSPAWEIEQLTRLYERRPELVRAALHKLIAEDPDLQWQLVVGAYLDRQINLGKAAELLSTSEADLRDRFIELGIPLRIGPADVEEARAEVAAVRNWYTDSQ